MCFSDAIFELGINYNFTEEQNDICNTIIDDNYDMIFKKYQTPGGLITLPQFSDFFFEILELLNGHQQQQAVLETESGAVSVPEGQTPEAYAAELRAQIEE